jgi:HAD superfamily hydrolase (TIGR01484 family)
LSAFLQPLRRAELSKVRAIFADVDGTLTTSGRLTASTLRALEGLEADGVRVVLVSGRPAGWAECWARQWPVAGVVAENGGLYLTFRRGRLRRVYSEGPGERVRNRAALRRHVAAALAAVPGARLSSDSAATEVDLAIDHAEDAHLGPGAAAALEAFLAARGVTAVRSSVHVNCWLGRFDKLTAVRRFLRREWRTALRPREDRFAFVGDSLNDAPMFRAFPLSVGVANVRRVVQELEALPAFVTRAPEGRGFEELARVVRRAGRLRLARSKQA